MNDALQTYYDNAIKNQIPVISKDGIEFMKQQILDNQISSILEIGSAVGFSALFFAMETNANVYTIERDLSRFKQMQDAVTLFGYTDQITMIFDDATTHQMPENFKCDLLFIDAAKAQNKLFLEKYSPYLNDDGFIIVDNLIFHDYVNIPLEQIESRNLRGLIRKIIAFRHWIIENDDWDVTFFDAVGDGMAIIKRRKTQ
ncbi:MAG: O-methyltransferase [Culicoidibacterales bacterium]